MQRPQLPTTMRAVRFDGPNMPPRTERLPLPCPRASEALVKVAAAGVCHTELQQLDGTLDLGVWPLTPGHEISGTVVEGPPRLVGRNVLVYYGRPCGECSWCAAGQEQVCPNMGPQPGLSTDGGYAEYVAIPADCLIELPDGLDPMHAAPLGCAAATAFHALHGVAAVEPGETVVVCGVGGVGLPLIELCRLTGARVLAVGRSAAKLEAARALGAEVVDATEGDPALAVARLTRGEGAHVVFELVGSDETLELSMRMVRRRGRLVLVGYGSGRLRLNPLSLVLRETQLLSSVGNTRAELREVVRLAAAEQVHVPVAGEFALEDAELALAALRSGELSGRAVLLPSLSPSARALATEPAVRLAEPAVRLAEPATMLEQNGVTRAERVEAPARDAAPPAAERDAAQHSRPLEQELLDFVARGLDVPSDDDEFNHLALRLFAYQFEHVTPYRLLCVRRGQTPLTVTHWRQIPPVPIAAFKETLLAAEGTDGAAEFNSSGTTRPEHKSRHFHPSLELYNLNAALNFKAHVLPDTERMRITVLFPRRQELPHSSLAHWLTLMVERFGLPGSDWYVTNADGLQAERVVDDLRRAREPVALLAASFGLVHLLEHLQAHGLSLALPPGSRVMDTGGYKGRSREYAKDELYGMVGDLLGVRPTHIVNMYGMTEHGTQFLDAVLRDHLRNADADRALSRYKTVPPWARTLVVDPETLRERPPGERGVLLHVDLINRTSVLAVLTEDVGHTVGDGFEVLGRAQGAEARGCSIALDELIEAQRA